MYPWHSQLSDFCQTSIDYLEAADRILKDRGDQTLQEQDSEWVSLSMARSLLLKAAEDLRAVACLDAAGLVGPTYAVARSLFEALVDMLYLVHSDASERHARSLLVMCSSLVEDGCARILAAKIQRLAATEDAADYDSLQGEALAECLHSMRDQIAGLDLSEKDLKQLSELVSSWERLASDHGHKALARIRGSARPGMRQRIKGVKEQHSTPGVSKNLEFSYRVIYSQASAFVHSSGGVYLAGRGRPIEDLGPEPASFVVLVARDIVWMSNQIYGLGLPESVQSVLEKAKRTQDALS